jgi:hypothetical protein
LEALAVLERCGAERAAEGAVHGFDGAKAATVGDLFGGARRQLESAPCRFEPQPLDERRPGLGHNGRKRQYFVRRPRGACFILNCMDRFRERAALALATALFAVGLYGVPWRRGALLDVCHHAVIAGAVTLLLLFVTRRLGARGIAVERAWSALFLAGMPVVYIVGWLAARGGGASGAWLWVELLGLPIYSTLALLGVMRSPWFLVGGIAAHGVAWDAWHYALDSAYIPTWYVTGCLLADVGLSLYLATRVSLWRAARS